MIELGLLISVIAKQLTLQKMFKSCSTKLLLHIIILIKPMLSNIIVKQFLMHTSFKPPLPEVNTQIICIDCTQNYRLFIISNSHVSVAAIHLGNSSNRKVQQNSTKTSEEIHTPGMFFSRSINIIESLMLHITNSTASTRATTL